MLARLHFPVFIFGELRSSGGFGCRRRNSYREVRPLKLEESASRRINENEKSIKAIDQARSPGRTGITFCPRICVQSVLGEGERKNADGEFKHLPSDNHFTQLCWARWCSFLRNDNGRAHYFTLGCTSFLEV